MKPVPPPPEVDPAQWAGLARRLRLAWAVLVWERLWPLVLPPLCLVGLFVAFALFDVAPSLPVWLHGLVLAVTGGGLAFGVVRAGLHLAVPTWDEAARRLEQDSGLPHRPLAALVDRPAADDAVGLALWQAHLRRAAACLGALRLSWPRSDMAARDPWGLRAAVLLVLVIAAVGARDDAPRRLARALSPAVHTLGPDSVEVWLSPPAYTGLAPLLLRPNPSAPVSVPVGSTVLAVLSGGWGTARLELDGHSQPFQRQGDGSQRAEARLDRPTRLAVRQSLLTVAAWTVQVAADAVPSAEFTQPPEAGERGRLRLAVAASDDYGLTHVRARIRRVGAAADPDTVMVELPLAGGHPRGAEAAAWVDLTAHPWAGLPVTIQPEAEDGLGQIGAGTPVMVTLPQRHFDNPVAAVVVEQRRAVTEDPARVAQAVEVLDAIATDPALFDDDLKTFLMLRAARHALAADGGFDHAEVQDLLWQAALRLEDGDLAGAEQALNQARRALEQALDQGAGADEVRALLDQVQQALARYTQALAEKAVRDGGAPGVPPLQADGQTVDEEQLRQMLDQLRALADAGARDALRQMLGQLGQIIDGLQAGAGQSAGGPAQDGLRRLQDLARRQQALLDDSHRRTQEGAPGPGGTDAAAQDDVRRALAEAARKLGQGLGETPSALAEADGAMAAAGGLLRRGEWGDAAAFQATALAALRQAAREAVEQLGLNGQGGPGLMVRDPLGRPLRSGAGDDRTTRIPDHAELQRSRQLLDEIRRRAGDLDRPEPERDYLKRLLKQF